VDSKNLELPWKKPRSSASPPTGKRKEKKRPSWAPHTYIPELYFSVPACLSIRCVQTVL
jgi:hypothetical protein